MPRKIPSQNKSPYGWWIATVIQRYVYDDEDVNNPRRRSTALANNIMVKARDRNHAYRKVVAYAEICKGDEGYITEKSGRRLRIVYQGISDLYPVYDEFDEDGFEVSYTEYKNISVCRIKSWLREKHELQAFNDDVEE